MELYCLTCSVKQGSLVPLKYSVVCVPRITGSVAVTSPHYCPVCKQDYFFETEDDEPTAEKIAQFCVDMVNQYTNLFHSIADEIGLVVEEEESKVG